MTREQLFALHIEKTKEETLSFAKYLHRNLILSAKDITLPRYYNPVLFEHLCDKHKIPVCHINGWTFSIGESYDKLYDYEMKR